MKEPVKLMSEAKMTGGQGIVKSENDTRDYRYVCFEKELLSNITEPKIRCNDFPSSQEIDEIEDLH